MATTTPRKIDVTARTEAFGDASSATITLTLPNGKELDISVDYTEGDEFKELEVKVAMGFRVLSQANIDI